MTEYVAGFMFDGEKVALVVKNRPKWQAGRMNGIGGHVEEDELPLDAMVREFEEETGKRTGRSWWTNFVSLQGEGFVVHFYFAHGDLSGLYSLTDEKIVVVPVSEVNVLNSIPNLTWLIPLAKSMAYARAGHFTITGDE